MEVYKIKEMKSNFCKIMNIKSNYILKDFLQYANKNIYLNLISNNKAIQNRIGINIGDYKNQAKKIKIGERSGLGKEYKLNGNILLFEGEYINGKKMEKEKNIMKMVILNLKENS